MSKDAVLKRYLFMSFSQIFFPFFFVLVFIASLVLLIDIAGRTYVVKMSFLDLSTFFAYLLPGNLFFIIPIALFASLVIGLSRLAYDYELIVCFSLGFKPSQIIRIFFPITLLATIILLVFSFIMLPLAKSASENFISQKKADIDINIKPGEFGQKLGDWLIYVDDVKNRHYKDLILFSESSIDRDAFIVADSGQTDNDKGLFTLNLTNGSAYFANNNELKKMDYENMLVRQNVSQGQLSSYDLIEYWHNILSAKYNPRKFTHAFVVSLFPIVSIFFIPLFSIANPRFSSNKSYFYVIISVSIYFLAMHIAAEHIPIIGAFSIPIIWLFAGFYLYKKFIAKYY